MGNSLMIACSKLGMHFVACTTKKYFPNQELVDLCRTYAEASGGSVTLTEDVQTGTKDADVGDEQFEINDSRSFESMYQDMEQEGLQPVLNDYLYV